MDFREARDDDAPAIALLLHDCDERCTDWDPGWDKTQTPEEYAAYALERIETPDAWVWLAAAGDAVVGVVSFEPADGAAAHLRMLYVAPTRWREGIATQLVNDAYAEMRRRGYASTYLWAMERDPRARSFYEQAGWRPDGARRFHERWEQPMVRYIRDL